MSHAPLLAAALALPQDGEDLFPPDGGGGDGGQPLPPWDCQENQPRDSEYEGVAVLSGVAERREFHATHVEFLIGSCADGTCEYDFEPPARSYDWAGPDREESVVILTAHPAITTPPGVPGDGKVRMWPEGEARPIAQDGPIYPCTETVGNGGATDPDRPNKPPYVSECYKGPLKSATVYGYSQLWFVRGRKSIATAERQICDDCEKLSEGVYATTPKATFVRDNYGAYYDRKTTKSEACANMSPTIASWEPTGFPNPVLIAESVFR